MSLCYLSSSSVISPGIYLTHILNANTLFMWILPANIRQRLVLFFIPGVTFFSLPPGTRIPSCVPFNPTQSHITPLSSDSFAQHCSITIPLRSSGTLFPPIFPSPFVYYGIYENLCSFSSYTRKSRETKVSAKSKVYKRCSVEEKADTVRFHQHTEASAHSGCVGGLIIYFFKVLVLLWSPTLPYCRLFQTVPPWAAAHEIPLRNPAISSFHLNCYSFMR